MSISGFHHNFKAVTAMSPLQFHKQLRLQEARRLLLSGGVDAATAGYRVGYDEPSRRAAQIGGESEPPRGLIDARRRLDLELGKLEIRARLRELTPPIRRGTPFATGADVFVCHASEDKDRAARPIAEALKAKGYKVWLDETELKVGDRLLDQIDEGLANCRFGLVILSPAFFGKNWTRRELAGLVAREDAEERTIILPVRLDVDAKTIARHLPSLAGVLAAKMSAGLEQVVSDIVHAMGAPSTNHAPR
jgi:hypothetical protein